MFNIRNCITHSARNLFRANKSLLFAALHPFFRRIYFIRISRLKIATVEEYFKTDNAEAEILLRI